MWYLFRHKANIYCSYQTSGDLCLEADSEDYPHEKKYYSNL